MAIIKHQFTITYESTIDTETGEIISTNIVKKSKPAQKEAVSDECKLYLEDNKCRLTPKAIELMRVQVGDKLDIKYDEVDKLTMPVIGTDEVFKTGNGCKLTKSLTIAYRGKKNEELSKYGSEFNITPHKSKEGLFILDSGKIPEQVIVKDENIQLPEEINLDDFLDDTDANIESVDSNMFQL